MAARPRIGTKGEGQPWRCHVVLPRATRDDVIAIIKRFNMDTQNEAFRRSFRFVKSCGDLADENGVVTVLTPDGERVRIFL